MRCKIFLAVVEACLVSLKSSITKGLARYVTYRRIDNMLQYRVVTREKKEICEPLTRAPAQK